MRRAIWYVIAVVILLILIGVIRDNNTKTNQLRKVQSELQTLQVEAEKLDEALKKEQHIEHKNDKKVDELLEQKKIREKKIDDLIRQLQAKRKGNIAYASPEPVHRTIPSVRVTGSCESWMAAAGISDLHNARILIGRESGCNPTARNPRSGACGIPQALPCSKLPGYPNDPVAQLRWMQGYVMGRYGSWAAAVSHSSRVGWY